MAVAVATFLVVLAVIATERVHRTKVALLGAAIVVLFVGEFDQEKAIDAVDFNTIGLLAGMMILVFLTQQSGVYDYIAIRAGQISRGRPLAVVMSLAGTTAVLSAFLDNLTTILLVVPITFLLADALDIDPIPLVIIEIVASNIGGTATPIGAIAFVAVTVALYLHYRPRLLAEPRARQRLMELDAARSIADRDELVRTVPILVATILAFFAHKALGLEPATVALAGATAMLLATRQPLDKALAGIEWPTLFFFLGLFVMVGALEETGAIRELADGIGALTDGDRTAELLGIAWVSVLGSGIVDNIPFTATMVPVVEQLQEGNSGDDAYWWALAIGACFGGNATLIAAAANVAAAGLAARAGRPIGFVTFLKVGLPATALSMALGTAYIALRYIA